MALSGRKKPRDCFHYHPRLGVWCQGPVVYVADYAGGVGACKDHAGELVKWCLDTRRSIEIHDVEFWNYKVENNLFED